MNCPDFENWQSWAVRRPRPTLPSGRDFWVFGYGSLMWNPEVPHVEVRPARVHGLRRTFCVYSMRYRGTPQRPGLVLGLDRGGSCHGMTFRVPAAEAEAALDLLWEREMVSGVYHPRFLSCRTPQGTVEALGFVVDRRHPQYCGHLALQEVAALIAQGEGQRGRCCDYLANTVAHLAEVGIRDRHLLRLLEEVSALQPNAEPPLSLRR